MKHLRHKIDTLEYDFVVVEFVSMNPNRFVSPSSIMNALGCRDMSGRESVILGLRKALDRLHKRGDVIRVKTGKYNRYKRIVKETQ